MVETEYECNAPDLSKVSRLPLAADDRTRTTILTAALGDAREYIKLFEWWKNIKAEYFGYGAEVHSIHFSLRDFAWKAGCTGMDMGDRR
ncbi:hypothetical protein ACFSQT_27090 [Mesorhizobium calcicola]|uniref:Uncharacterized protein n=1 Tax=Mesorhizobium calcicola TaxID=1300310 RepID=A0ABW4WKV5_9HYPH